MNQADVIATTVEALHEAIADVHAALGTCTDLDVLAAALHRLDRSGASHEPGAKQSLGTVVDDLKARMRPLLTFGENTTVEGVGVLVGSSAGGSTKWADGGKIARLIAVRTADRANVDPESGEVLDTLPPLAVIAEQIAAELVQCGGLDNASASWRSTELAARGIDADDYRSKTDTRPSVRWLD